MEWEENDGWFDFFFFTDKSLEKCARHLYSVSESSLQSFEAFTTAHILGYVSTSFEHLET